MAKMIETKGFDGLYRRLKNTVTALNHDSLEDKMLGRAEELKDKIKSAAPQGPTGNLKRSIVAKKFRNKIKNSPAVFVAIDRVIAPHAHLVEFGTKFMSPRPFWRNTIDANSRGLMNKLRRTIWTVIEREAKKK
jgi:HK97 gp10 family phage protein